MQKHTYISDISKRDTRIMLKSQTMTGVKHVFLCLLLFVPFMSHVICITLVGCSSTVFGFFFNRLIFHIL